MTTPRGTDLLHDPRRNKSTAFSAEEREAFGLLGLLPEGIDDLDTQLRRALAQLDGKTTDLERYIYLSQLQDTDETANRAGSAESEQHVSCDMRSDEEEANERAAEVGK